MVSAKRRGPAAGRLVHDCGKRLENGVFQNTSTAEWSKLWGASRQCSALLSRSSHRSASHRISTPTHTGPPVWRWCTYCSLFHCTAHTALQTLHTRTAQTRNRARQATFANWWREIRASLGLSLLDALPPTHHPPSNQSPSSHTRSHLIGLSCLFQPQPTERCSSPGSAKGASKGPLQA